VRTLSCCHWLFVEISFVVRGGSNTPTITVIIGKVYKLIEVFANHIIKGGGVWGGVTK
jgi:hypothetical protein